MQGRPGATGQVGQAMAWQIFLGSYRKFAARTAFLKFVDSPANILEFMAWPNLKPIPANRPDFGRTVLIFASVSRRPALIHHCPTFTRPGPPCCGPWSGRVL